MLNYKLYNYNFKIFQQKGEVDTFLITFSPSFLMNHPDLNCI